MKDQNKKIGRLARSVAAGEEIFIDDFESFYPGISELEWFEPDEKITMKELMNPHTPLSNCCNTPLKVISDDEGTSYYECKKCHNPADLRGETPLPKDVEDRFDEYFPILLKSTTGTPYMQGATLTNEYHESCKWQVKQFLIEELQKARDEERELIVMKMNRFEKVNRQKQDVIGGWYWLKSILTHQEKE